MATEPLQCRKAGCNQPCTLLSVFCVEHHAEQLQRIGAKIRTTRDLLERFWNLRERSVLTDQETVLAFFDNVVPDTVVSAFDDLSLDFQSFIRDYLRETAPEQLPRCRFVGPASEEAIEAATLKCRAAAQVLLDSLTRRSS